VAAVALVVAVVGVAAQADAFRCSTLGNYDVTQDCVLSANGQPLAGGNGLPQMAQCECNWHNKFNSAMVLLNGACTGASCNINSATLTSLTVNGGATITGALSCNSLAVAFGSVASFFQSISINNATTGVFRMANNEFLVTRNVANNADIPVIGVDNSGKDRVIIGNATQPVVVGTVTKGVLITGSGTVNVTGSVEEYLCSPSVGAVTYNLPACGVGTSPNIVTVKRIQNNANACTVARNGLDTMEGAAANVAITNSVAPFHGCTFVCDGTGGWWESGAASGGCP
jgi:hypothetical protein